MSLHLYSFLIGLALGLLFGGACVRAVDIHTLLTALRGNIRSLGKNESYHFTFSVGRCDDNEDDDGGGEGHDPLPELLVKHYQEN
jgi:hypothetical protein